MPRLWWVAAVVALQFVVATPSGAVTQPFTAYEYWQQQGFKSAPSVPGPLGPSTPGNLWNNGPEDNVDGASSERDAIISGTGGADGNDGSTLANDFVLTARSTLTEIRACFQTDATSAEMYIYTDNGGVPGPAVTSPLFGSPTTAHVVSSTYTENTARCFNPSFGLYPGREFRFNLATTGVALPVLTAGRYWLAVVGIGGTRAFWATSTATAPPLAAASLDAQAGSTYYAIPYWTDIATNAPGGPTFKEFAFDIDGTPSTPALAPAASRMGLVFLAVVLLVGGIVQLRRLRHQS